MDYFDIRVLEEFYARISADGGISVLPFQSELASLFKRPRSEPDIDNFRTSKGPWKKLADEVVPISRFLRLKTVETGRVRFSLNDKVPDCWFWPLLPDCPQDPVGIEVTIAQGTERFYLATELVGKRVGRGFIGLPDDAPRAAFKNALSKDRVMYTPDQALLSVKKGVLRCLSRKNDRKFSGFLLLIQAHLLPLPQERWETIMRDLCAAAADSPFAEAYMIGDTDHERSKAFQIK
jgi:hypothetical protein